MKGKKLILFFILLIFCVKNIHAETVPAAFVDIGFGARASAMGNAFTAVSDDMTAILWNPAGLTQVNGREILATYANQKGLVPYSFVAAGPGVFTFLGCSFGAGVLISGDNALKETTAIFSYAQSMGTIPYIGDIPPWLSLGASFKVRQAEFGNNPDGGVDRVTGNAWGTGWDAGIMIRFTEKVVFGLCAKDIIAPLRWSTSSSGEYYEDVPKQFSFGMSYRGVGQDLKMGFDIYNLKKMRAGVEKGIIREFFIRGGMSVDIAGEDKENEFYAGFGVDNLDLALLKLSFDFAYCFEKLANTLKVSTSIRF